MFLYFLLALAAVSLLLLEKQVSKVLTEEKAYCFFLGEFVAIDFTYGDQTEAEYSCEFMFQGVQYIFGGSHVKRQVCYFSYC